jgi:S-adenosylmethionine/arginine decarboxylase-like enzyme
MFDEILRRSGFNVLNVSEHHFQPQGYTALWLLCESHFAVHTFPEFGRSYIELSSCNLEYYQNFLNETKQL